MEIELAKCDCCGLKEECTINYISEVKGNFEGKWLCGLCSEAVRDEVNRGKKKQFLEMNEAVKAHMSFCRKYKSNNPAVRVADGMRQMLRRRMLKKYQHDPQVLQYVSKYFFSENVYDDDSTDRPKPRWRIRNDLASAHMTCDDDSDNKKINSEKTDLRKTNLQRKQINKLRKLPHVFNNVLELPFRYDTDVTVEENEGFFRFVAETELEGAGNYGQVRAQAVEIHPGITKIVVTNGDNEIKLLLEELNVDTWRYRLPASTMPELATAVVVDGELIVTVPNRGRGRGRGRGEFDGGRLVLVQ
ncbi:hypothetical protein K7X08_004797 [Anisodus acutangulus]|uniref:Uncharacterized protein n=1 Tax=Anisodus acutangulus TaxID=402998 RepID=A0A9Q1RIZ9_9SOLA|nr:hypothetical protein K7X08_004797 [Anisodus acutangulus]